MVRNPAEMTSQSTEFAKTYGDDVPYKTDPGLCLLPITIAKRL